MAWVASAFNSQMDMMLFNPLRLQEVSLRYSLKHLPWIKSVGLSSVDLEFVANNLFTIDKVKYFDPEQASANGAVYPIPATYAFQVYLRF